jgi:preprotein translocase subunit SecD
MEEARDLALVLRAGALPARVNIIEERTVGPSLGQDSIDQGQLAGMVGILFVIGIMMIYYKVAGVLAVGALSVYVVLVLGGLAGDGGDAHPAGHRRSHPVDRHGRGRQRADLRAHP